MHSNILWSNKPKACNGHDQCRRRVYSQIWKCHGSSNRESKSNWRHPPPHCLNKLWLQLVKLILQDETTLFCGERGPLLLLFFFSCGGLPNDQLLTASGKSLDCLLPEPRLIFQSLSSVYQMCAPRTMTESLNDSSQGLVGGANGALNPFLTKFNWFVKQKTKIFDDLTYQSNNK